MREAEVPAGKVVHVFLDNYAAHKHPKVRRWLGRHLRFVFHFTPTSASWLNAVEGFFAKLAKRRLRRGVFHSLVALQEAINRFVAEINAKPRPFAGPRTPTGSSPPRGVDTKRWTRSARRPRPRTLMLTRSPRRVLPIPSRRSQPGRSRACRRATAGHAGRGPWCRRA